MRSPPPASETPPHDTPHGRLVALEYSRHGSTEERWRAAVLAALRDAGSIPEAAKRLAVSERTLYRWVAWLRDEEHPERLAGEDLPELPAPGRPATPAEN